MGTKRHLAHHVRKLAKDFAPGPLLDGFSGMCAIGRSIAEDRQIWSNDLQAFAHTVATAQFCSVREKVDVDHLVQAIKPLFSENVAQCVSSFASVLTAEANTLEQRDISAAINDFDESRIRAQQISCRASCGPIYSLISSRYGGTYFGHRQAVEGDSLRYGLDTLLAQGRIDNDTHRWGLVALCAALARVSTTTGHFAQPLRPKPTGSIKHFGQRTRCVWSEWLYILPTLLASGTRAWRQRNSAFQGETIDLLMDLRGAVAKPSVIYADPPYTKDQYSRYYHVLETVILYDFPECHGSGLYRVDRATSSFSHTSKVEEALDRLIECSRRLSASLILSYPAEGLLSNSTSVIPRMIVEHYGCYPDILEFDYHHSTMGASKGTVKTAVREILYKVAA